MAGKHGNIDRKGTDVKVVMWSERNWTAKNV